MRRPTTVRFSPTELAVVERATQLTPCRSRSEFMRRGILAMAGQVLSRNAVNRRKRER